MRSHKHSPILDVHLKDDVVKQFCICGFLRYGYGAEPARREYTLWRQAETLDEINEYSTEMALAKDRH